MTNVTNHHTASLGLPSGQIVPAGATVLVENWDAQSRHPVVKGWLDAKALSAQDVDPPKPQESSPMSVADLLAKEDTLHFQTFKAEAKKILGEETPDKKDDIVAALKAKVQA